MSTSGTARRIVLIREHKGAQYGNVLDEATAAYASGFAAHGYLPQIVECGDVEPFLDEVPRLVADPAVAAFFSVGGKGLLCTRADGSQATPFDSCAKPVIVQHGDHPYQSWIRQVVRVEFPGKLTFFNDPTSIDYVRRLPQDAARTFYSPPCIFGTDLPYGAGGRDIPVIFVGIIDNPRSTRGRLVAEYPELGAAFDALLEHAVNEMAIPLVQKAAEVIATLGSDLDLLSERGQIFLHRCDWAIRHLRRRRCLFRVRRHPVLVVAQKPGTWPGMHPDSRFVARLPFQEVLALCDRARVVLLPQPTYPYGLTERILFCMDRGVAVVANWSPVVDRHFEREKDLLMTRNDFSDVEARLDQALDERVRAPMAERARAAVRRQFMPAQVTGGYLARARTAGLIP